jgi:hypothetical protein
VPETAAAGASAGHERRRSSAAVAHTAIVPAPAIVRTSRTPISSISAPAARNAIPNAAEISESLMPNTRPRSAAGTIRCTSTRP